MRWRFKSRGTRTIKKRPDLAPSWDIAKPAPRFVSISLLCQHICSIASIWSLLAPCALLAREEHAALSRASILHEQDISYLIRRLLGIITAEQSVVGSRAMIK